MIVGAHTQVGMKQLNHRLIVRLSDAFLLWSSFAPFLAAGCAKEEVPVGGARWEGITSRCPRHCDNERLFGLPDEPKVMVSVLFKLRRGATRKSSSEIRLDHGDLLVMDVPTQSEYEHSTSSELSVFGVSLTFRSTSGCAMFG